MIREACGTKRGALAHEAQGEPLCGWCAHAEQVRRLSAERVARLPAAAGFYQPVTAAEARQNAALLDAEVHAYELDRRHPHRHLARAAAA
jgi:hypothetical protein